MEGAPTKKQRREANRAVAREAARRADRRRRGRVISLWAAGVVAVALIAVVIAVNSGSDKAPASVTASDPVLGKRSAPVTIHEYGDFKCPFCTRFAIKTEPQLRRQFVDSGKVRLVWHDFVNIDAESLPAAQAARCAAAQHRFWQYHDALYSYAWNNFYARGASAEGAQAFSGHYEELAVQVGLNVDSFRSCIAAGSYRDTLTAAHDTAAGKGVGGTPTFFINGQRVVGAQPYDVFRRLIEAQLGGK